ADHSLLALGDHDLDGLHVELAERHPIEVDVEAHTAPRHLGERRGEARRAEILQRLDETALDEREARFDQLLAREWIADLDGRALVLVLVGELLAGEHARAADPVAPGCRAEEDHVVAGAPGLGARKPVGGEEPHAHGVDERVRGVGVVEDGVAAHRRHADAVSVVPDPADRAAELETGLAEAQAVEERDGAGAHGDDVTEDPADSRRCALEGLDRGRMVVALDLERDGLALAEVDDAGVLARPLEDARAFRGEALEQERRVLVTAVLRPQEREDRELEVVRPAREQCLDTVELPVREAERAMQRAVSNGAQEAWPTISTRAEGEEAFRRYPERDARLC